MDKRLSRLRASLLGRLSREMHGAVTDYIGYKGEPYRVNLGVALHTIRSIAQSELRDKELSKILYQEGARELKLASLWLISPEDISPEELDFWAEGLLNTEVCEEAAFALLHKVEGVERLLYSDSELAIYCALISMSYLTPEQIIKHLDRITQVALIDSHHIAYGVVLALDKASKERDNIPHIKSAIESIKGSKRGDYIHEEMEWRLEEF